MTGRLEERFRDWDREEPAWVAWAAHKLGLLLTLVTLGLIVRIVLLVTGQGFLDSWLFGYGLTALLLGFLVVEVLTQSHFSRMCAPCMASVPEDGGVRIQRRRWRWVLRSYHLMHSRPGVHVLVGLILALIAFNLIAGPENVTISSWMWTVMNLLVYTVLSGSTLLHRPLTMWCPWCRWDEGGDHEHSPDPVVPGTKVST